MTPSPRPAVKVLGEIEPGSLVLVPDHGPGVAARTSVGSTSSDVFVLDSRTKIQPGPSDLLVDLGKVTVEWQPTADVTYSSSDELVVGSLYLVPPASDGGSTRSCIYVGHGNDAFLDVETGEYFRRPSQRGDEPVALKCADWSISVRDDIGRRRLWTSKASLLLPDDSRRRWVRRRNSR